MVPTWRLGLAALSVLLVYFLTRPVMAALMLAIRRRVGKRFRWVGDIQRFLLVYISWITMFLLYLVIAIYLLELNNESDIVQVISYFMAIPLVLGTFALRIVVTNMIVRHFKWDRASHEYDARIFVVTETTKFLCFILIMVEIFYIFFLSNDVAGFLLAEVFIVLEIILILSGFTLLKNIATGMFLVFAEPFRTGSFCEILDLQGYVEKVSLARTIMRKQDGSLVYVPNGVFADFLQTNNSTADAFRHELVIQLSPTTAVAQILTIRDDLVEALADFCAVIPQHFSLSGSVQRASILSSSLAESGFRQSSSSVGEPLQLLKALQVGLSDMYRLKIRMTIDQSLFSSVEAAKTEVSNESSGLCAPCDAGV